MPASFGVQGPGDSTIASGFGASTSSTRDLVVAMHDHVRAQLAEEVDEVEGEAVVVIDQDDHAVIAVPARFGLNRVEDVTGAYCPRPAAPAKRSASSAARNRARALLTHSSCSSSRIAVGDDAGAGLHVHACRP